MKIDPNVYGYVNGQPVYSHEEFRYKARGFGAIESDEELIAYAEQVTHGWSSAGWKHSFTDFYLSDYALSEPYASLTHKEFARLKELQTEAIAEEKRKDEAREWKFKCRYYYADNSEEEVWVDKDGIEKTIMVVAPHGDAC